MVTETTVSQVLLVKSTKFSLFATNAVFSSDSCLSSIGFGTVINFLLAVKYINGADTMGKIRDKTT